LSKGDIVTNKEARPLEKIGVLIEKCDLHAKYWKVFHEGSLEVWFEPNLATLREENE
tara:strand:+ start:360 stop:530 length:171 start_codon:yes stop_codon:yes gene_type:complete